MLMSDTAHRDRRSHRGQHAHASRVAATTSFLPALLRCVRSAAHLTRKREGVGTASENDGKGTGRFHSMNGARRRVFYRFPMSGWVFR